MSHSSYSASERRGILVIAILAFVLIGAGITLSLCSRNSDIKEIPVVIQHPELVDSTSLNTKNEKSSKRKDTKVKKTTSRKTKSKKTYRKRSPLDEPV